MDENLIPQDQSETELNQPLFTEEDTQPPRSMNTYPRLQAGVAHATDVPTEEGPVNAKEVADLAFSAVNADRNAASMNVANTFAQAGMGDAYDGLARDISARNKLETAQSNASYEVYKQKLDEVFKQATENVVAESPRVLANNPEKVIPTIERVGAETAADARMEQILKDVQEHAGSWRDLGVGILKGFTPFSLTDQTELNAVAQKHGLEPDEAPWYQLRSTTKEKLAFHYNSLPDDQKSEWLQSFYNDLLSNYKVSNLVATGMVMDILNQDPEANWEKALDFLGSVGDFAGLPISGVVAVKSWKLFSQGTKLRSMAMARAVAGGKNGLQAEEAAKIARSMQYKAVGAVAADITGVGVAIDAGKLISTGVRKLLPDHATLHAQDLLKPIFADTQKAAQELRDTLQAQGVSVPEIEDAIADFQRQYSAASNPHIHQVDFFTPKDMSETTARVVYKAENGSFSTPAAAEAWAQKQGLKGYTIIPDTTSSGHLVSAEHKASLVARKKELEAKIAVNSAAENAKATGTTIDDVIAGKAPPALPRAMTRSKAVSVDVAPNVKFTAKFTDAYDRLLYQLYELSQKPKQTDNMRKKMSTISGLLEKAGIAAPDQAALADRVYKQVHQLKKSEDAVNAESFIVPRIAFPRTEPALDTLTAAGKGAKYTFLSPLPDNLNSFTHSIADIASMQIVAYANGFDEANKLMKSMSGGEFIVLGKRETFKLTGTPIPQDSRGRYMIGGVHFDKDNRAIMDAATDRAMQNIANGQLPSRYTQLSPHRIISNTILAHEPRMAAFIAELDQKLGMEGQSLIIHHSLDAKQMKQATDAIEKEVGEALADQFRFWSDQTGFNGLYWVDQQGINHIVMNRILPRNNDEALKYASTLAHEYGHFFERVWVQKYGQGFQNDFANFLLERKVDVGSRLNRRGQSEVFGKLSEKDFEAYMQIRNPVTAMETQAKAAGKGLTGNEWWQTDGDTYKGWAGLWTEYFAERFATYALTSPKINSTLSVAWNTLVNGIKEIMKTLKATFGGKFTSESEFINKQLDRHIDSITNNTLRPPPADQGMGAWLNHGAWNGQQPVSAMLDPSEPINLSRKALEDELAGINDQLRMIEDAEKGLHHGYLVESIAKRNLGYDAIKGFDPEDISSMIRYNAGDWAIGTSSEVYRQRVVGTHAESRYRRILTEFVRPSLEKLDKNGRILLDNILVAGDKDGRVFTPTEVYGFGADKKVAEAYYRVRSARDLMYDIRNDTAVQVMTRDGYRSIDTKHITLDDSSEQLIGRVVPAGDSRAVGRRIYDPVSDKWYEGDALEDMDVLQLADAVSINGNKYSYLAMPKGTWTERTIEKVIPYRPGEYKRIYSDEYWVKVKSQETVDGAPAEVKKVWRTARSKAEANAFIKDVNEAVRAIKGGARAEDVAHLLEPYAIVPERIVEEVRAGDWEGISLEWNYNRTDDDYTKQYSRHFNGWSSHRGERVSSIYGEDTVNTLNPIDALSSEISATARVASIADWRQAAINRWFVEFSEDIPFEYRKLGAEEAFWKVYNDKGIYTGDNQRLKFMERVAHYVVHELGVPTAEERFFRGAARQISEAVEGALPPSDMSYLVGSALRKSDNFPRWARTISFHSFFGFNPIQLAVQAQNAVNAIAVSPLHGLKAAYNGLAIRVAMMSDNEKIWRRVGMLQNLAELGLKDVDEFVETVRAVKRTGLLDGINSTALFGQETGKWGLFNGLRRKVGGASAFFFNRGEEASRIVSFDIARREFITSNPGVAWWTDENLARIVARQDDLTQNMTTANQAMWQKGVVSVPLQFTQYQMKFIMNFMAAMAGKSRSFTRADAGRLLLFHGMFYGTAGLWLGETVREWIGSHTDSWSEEERLMVQQGLVAGGLDMAMQAITGEEMKLAIGTRFNTFRFYEQFTDAMLASIDKNNPDAPTFLEVAMGASGFATARGAQGLYKVGRLFYAAPMNSATLQEGLTILAAGSLSTLNNAMKYDILKRNYNMVQDGKRNNLYKVTDLEAYALAFGITPVNAEDLDTLYKSKKAWTARSDAYAETISTYQRMAIEARRDGDEKKAESLTAAIQVLLNGMDVRMRADVSGKIRIKGMESMQRKLLIEQVQKGFQTGPLVDKDIGRTQ